ncbi:MAG: RDD family protein [Desulfitobacteriaceae bacterium]
MNLKQIQITTPEQVSLNFNIAGLGSRATAHILDCLILGFISSALSLSLMKILKDLSIPFPSLVTSYVNAILILILFLLLWGYFVLFEFFTTGRTPGKMLVGIRVIQDNGQSITFLTSAVRNLIRLIDFLPLFYLCGILMIFFHSQHKRVGDLASGTIVVYQRKTKRKKKKNPLEKEINKRLAEHQVLLDLNEWSKKKIGIREWNLLKTYIKRQPSLTLVERKEITMQVAGILLPLIGEETANKPLEEVENTLFTLYLLLKEDWQYEDE